MFIQQVSPFRWNCHKLSRTSQRVSFRHLAIGILLIRTKLHMPLSYLRHATEPACVLGMDPIRATDTITSGGIAYFGGQRVVFFPSQQSWREGDEYHASSSTTPGKSANYSRIASRTRLRSHNVLAYITRRASFHRRSHRTVPVARCVRRQMPSRRDRVLQAEFAWLPRSDAVSSLTLWRLLAFSWSLVGYHPL